MQGVYHGLEAPEYLLSRECLQQEPQKFYDFVLQLYHPDAQPNIIHQKMAQLAEKKTVRIVTQNIDGLHEKAGSSNCINFHGSLYQCTCCGCGQAVTWQEYLQSDRHNCHGQIRPDVVLYGEGFTQNILTAAIEAVAQAELLVIVGTSFQVHPFCDLIHYKQTHAAILAVNQTEIYLPSAYHWLQEDASRLFEII